ncbi:hypothetical protein SJ05684_b41620 (plasmid) [Sinorhizobium sojae CCBAU 05684]|uniref:Uncharacterized protein n=1 Tax=Sinorhizobium sojae CCBAU 05684 TaxID=716928 RepID=A0A249PHI2_9HYPH|nr:hypothetical protein SJ05684_b41620 [Sinorhizobium sojae CCBAU 05684]
MKREAVRVRLTHVRTKLHAGDQVVAAVLLPVGDGRGGGETAHPLAQALGDRLEPTLIETIYPVGHEGGRTS